MISCVVLLTFTSDTALSRCSRLLYCLFLHCFYALFERILLSMIAHRDFLIIDYGIRFIGNALDFDCANSIDLSKNARVMER